MALKVHSAPLATGGRRADLQNLMDLHEAEEADILTIGLTQDKMRRRSTNLKLSSLDNHAARWAGQDLLWLGAVNYRWRNVAYPAHLKPKI